MLCGRTYTNALALYLYLPHNCRLFKFATDTICLGGEMNCPEEHERRYLKADTLVVCSSAEHNEIIFIAGLAVVLYPVGLLVLNAALLFSAREAIQRQRPSSLSRAISFLHSDFEPHMYWWELVEMLRRFVLVGLMVYVCNGSMIQIILGTLFSTIFLLVQVQAQPYVSRLDDQLASSCSFCLVVIFLCSYAFKNALFGAGINRGQGII